MGGQHPEIARLKNRRDFIAVKNGARAQKLLAHSRAFVLQGFPQENFSSKSSEIQPNRFGFTVTKRVGNSVVRNRIRRRMREAVRLHASQILAKHALHSHDFVMIGRIDALNLPFTEMIAELTSGLDHLAKKSTKQLKHMA